MSTYAYNFFLLKNQTAFHINTTSHKPGMRQKNLESQAFSNYRKEKNYGLTLPELSGRDPPLIRIHKPDKPLSGVIAHVMLHCSPYYYTSGFSSHACDVLFHLFNHESNMTWDRVRGKQQWECWP
jgi:hypothetical protein